MAANPFRQLVPGKTDGSERVEAVWKAWVLVRGLGLGARPILTICLFLAVAFTVGMRAFAGPYLVPILEERFTQPELAGLRRVDGIVALGGDPARMMEAIRLAKLNPEAKLILSGFGEERWYDYARKNGILPPRLIVERQATNTYENATLSRLAGHPQEGETWLLVTSASHMPRALGAFRKIGFPVVPWPVKTASDEQRLTLQTARHEWLGLIAYRLLGRTDSLLPGPDTVSHRPTLVAQTPEQRQPKS